MKSDCSQFWTVSLALDSRHYLKQDYRALASRRDLQAEDLQQHWGSSACVRHLIEAEVCSQAVFQKTARPAGKPTCVPLVQELLPDSGSGNDG